MIAVVVRSAPGGRVLIGVLDLDPAETPPEGPRMISPRSKGVKSVIKLSGPHYRSTRFPLDHGSASHGLNDCYRIAYNLGGATIPPIFGLEFVDDDRPDYRSGINRAQEWAKTKGE